MAKLTIKRARKILGTLADDIPDDVLENDIRTAELLKSIFFKQYTSRSTKGYNKYTNGKS